MCNVDEDLTTGAMEIEAALLMMIEIHFDDTRRTARKIRCVRHVSIKRNCVPLVFLFTAKPFPPNNLAGMTYDADLGVHGLGCFSVPLKLPLSCSLHKEIV